MLNPQQNAMIGLLLSSFPNFQSGDAESALAAYDLAISDYHSQDLADAVKAFVQGRVPGHNMAFAPTAPQLASACRRVMEARLDDARRHNSAVRQIAAREEDTPKSAENRARVAAMVAKAIKHLTMDDAKAADDYEARAAAIKKHDAYFDISPRYSVGDPDSEGDMGQREAS